MGAVSRCVDHEKSHRFLVVVAGPTAVGKSAIAMDLARQLGASIVNADAMQLYRGMDIGTSKVTAAERAAVPHLGLDYWDVVEPASVVDYRDRARAEIENLWAEGGLPMVVGGSQLYLRTLCDVLDVPPTDPVVRSRYERDLAEVGPQEMHHRLAQVAPDAAAAIHPGNGRRIVRALEAVELTGSFTARMPEPVPWVPTLWLGLTRDRDDLDLRIADRVETMWSQGLVPEVRQLRDRGLSQGLTARKAVGYEQVLRHLAGEISADEAMSDTVTATRRLARRQIRAFRANRRIAWCDAAASDLLDTLADRVRVFSQDQRN